MSFADKSEEGSEGVKVILFGYRRVFLCRRGLKGGQKCVNWSAVLRELGAYLGKSLELGLVPVDSFSAQV